MVKQIQLFLLPFAGGNSASFKKLEVLLDGRIEAVTVEYAGRHTRREEDFIDDYQCFLSDIVNYIMQRRNENIPFALFGYSLGSVLVYDILSKQLIGDAVHAFLCAKGSLFNKTSGDKYKEKSEDEFIQEIIALGGVDRRLLDNKRFLSIYMQPVKADYTIWDQYQYEEGCISCDATAIYSSRDPAAYGVHDWSVIIKGNVDYYDIGTNHFFINEYWEKVALIVNSHISKYLK